MHIEATDIRARYGSREALRGLSLSLRPGEMVGLIGPNGAGKSTLIRVLAGLYPLASGRLRYDQDDAARYPRARLARRLAYFAQNGEAEWPLTVEATVALGRLPHRRLFAPPSAADRAAIERALKLSEVEHLRSRSLRELSGGERARVLLARAIAVEAEALLVDEPVAALDPLHQLRTMELLRRTSAAGTGVIAALHDLTLAIRFCDRLLLLAEGRLVADAPARALDVALVRDAYGIEVLQGEHQGEPFMLPWRAKAQPSAIGPHQPGR
jgi:iron complex transport system ATP-binding protein